MDQTYIDHLEGYVEVEDCNTSLVGVLELSPIEKVEMDRMGNI